MERLSDKTLKWLKFGCEIIVGGAVGMLVSALADEQNKRAMKAEIAEQLAELTTKES